MSKTVVAFIGVCTVIVLSHAFKAMHQSTIVGQIATPKESMWVYAVNGTDSLKTMVGDTNGRFRLTVKPGAWKVLVTRNRMVQNEGVMIDVQEGSTMDVGTITFN
jgi:hypothetical protein